MDTTLTEIEEKTLIGLLYNHVSFGTTLQVFGEAGSENERIGTLRNVLEKLLLKYDLLKTLPAETLLIMGLVSYVSKDDLQTWAAPDATNMHLQKRAQYFLQKI